MIAMDTTTVLNEVRSLAAEGNGHAQSGPNGPSGGPSVLPAISDRRRPSLKEALAAMPAGRYTCLSRSWNQDRSAESVLLSVADEIPLVKGLVATLALACPGRHHSSDETLGFYALGGHITDSLDRMALLLGAVRRGEALDEAVSALPLRDAGDLCRESFEGRQPGAGARRALVNEPTVLQGYVAVLARAHRGENESEGALGKGVCFLAEHVQQRLAWMQDLLTAALP